MTAKHFHYVVLVALIITMVSAVLSILCQRFVEARLLVC